MDVHPILALLLPFVVLAVLVGLLRWTWGRGRSLAQRAPRPGEPRDYGLLVGVAAPRDAEETRRLGELLERAGIRHTLADTVRGPRLMVFADDAARARAALRDAAPPGS